MVAEMAMPKQVLSGLHIVDNFDDILHYYEQIHMDQKAENTTNKKFLSNVKFKL